MLALRYRGGLCAPVMPNLLRTPPTSIPGCEPHGEGRVSAEVNAALDDGKKVLIEGTQGFGLSLYHSGTFPRCTSKDTTAASFLSEVGVSPRRVTEIVVVFGPSLSESPGHRLGRSRMRLIGIRCVEKADMSTTSKSGRLSPTESAAWRGSTGNRPKWQLCKFPTSLAVNGVDYLSFVDRGKRSLEELSPLSQAFINRLEKTFLVPVAMWVRDPNWPTFLRLPNRALFKICSAEHRQLLGMSDVWKQAKEWKRDSRASMCLYPCVGTLNSATFKLCPRSLTIRKGRQAGLLSDQIRDYVVSGRMIEPFNPNKLKPAGYELSVGSLYSIGGKSHSLSDQLRRMRCAIKPFEVVIVQTLERLNLPIFLIARWNVRVKWASRVSCGLVQPRWMRVTEAIWTVLCITFQIKT